MKQKYLVIIGAAALLLAIFLTACGQAGAPKEPGNSEAGGEAQTVSGVINRKGDFLVLLTDDGDYQVMELGEGVSLDSFSEGDSVKVTYTGELGDEETPPVVSAIEMAA